MKDSANPTSSTVDLQRTIDELRGCLQALFTQVGESLVLLDSDGVICLWSPPSEALFGYRSEEMLGRADTFLIPADRLEETSQLRRQVLTGEVIEGVPTERLGQNGKRVAVRLSLCPIKDARGQAVALVEICRPLAQTPAPSWIDETAWNEVDRELELLLTGLPQEDEGEVVMAGHSPAFQEVRRQLSRLGPSEATVLILGESGTGKELVAHTLHQTSPRRDRPFVAVNCAAIPRELLESDLFGHERGAFTGAIRRKIGRLEAAQGGTVFLDEIGELPLELQPKLLRVLEECAFTRVGGVQEIALDVRFLVATNCPIEEQVRNGKFRQDLYYRLSATRLHLPPLRERLDDLPLLAEVLLQRAACRHRKELKRLSPEAEALLSRHSWPGNVRELANVLEQALLLCGGEQIGAGEISALLERGEELVMPQAGYPTDASLEQVEAEHIRRVLEAVHWHKTEAARALGIGRDTLYRKMQKYGLEK